MRSGSRSSLPRFTRWCIRQPALHFALLGGLLFAFQQRSGPDTLTVEPVVVPAFRLEQLRRDWQLRAGRPPSREEEEAALEKLVSEELLFREARRLGLDRGDLLIYRRLTEKMRMLSEEEKPVDEYYREALELGLDRDDEIVRRRLVQKMKLRAEAEGGPVRPTPEELEDYYQRHRDTFVVPARLRISHVFLSRQKHGDALSEASRALLDELVASAVDPQDAVSRGEAFLLGHHMTTTPEELDRSFGVGFAEQVMKAEPRTWTVAESAYGHHVVWIHEKQDQGTAALEDVRQQVLQGILAERRGERYEATLERLRKRWPVVVERPPESREGDGV